ncbi:hypothetical protein CISIN_1g048472mg [Citrus sinensis]|uniref:X8 domain-containing protein n=1 Tax=Citrus sinensis TaxID=2711 RepID=A0A067F6P5_CITSI|nr:hypothetical protein CISIN_1g048472mg [Citrus sinensis]
MAKQLSAFVLLLLIIFLLSSTMATVLSLKCFERSEITCNIFISLQPRYHQQMKANWEQATDTPNLDDKVSWEGQTTWCIAKPSTGDERLNANIQFCCQQPDIDCSIIQPGGRSYNPNNYYSHASVVMHLYYKANYKLPHTCDFMQSGLIISQDPSVGECIYEP